MTIFNRGVRGRRSADGTNIGGISDSFVENKYPVPSITGWSISGSDDTALNPAGGQTVIVNGGGFATGVAATLNGTTISPVTLVSPTQISFTSPALSGGSYTLIVYNSTGGAAILVPGLTYSSVPTYTTSAGSIGSVYETTAINTQVVATSDSSITYSLSSGSLPSGATLYANGVITGTAPVDSSSTTYTFAVTATDAELQDVTRTFTLTINVDVVTWVTPSSGATINLDGTAYSQALSASDAAGYSIASYTANALPSGLTLTSGTISGTPTIEGSTTTLLTATAATTGRSATNTVTWVVALGDIYFKYVSLLLSANSSIQTQSFASDNSSNNAVLAVSGDTRAQNFNPYQPGYYSNFFDGTGDYLTVPGSNNFVFAGDYTIEAWILSASTTWSIYSTGGSGAADQFSCDAGTLYWAYDIFGGGTASFFTVADVNKWTHIAASKSSGTTRLFKNGVVIATSTTNSSIGSTNTLNIGRRLDGSYSMNGYISNFRIVKGTAIYTAAFTPSTTPLTAVLGTQLLTCQSNNLSDNSANYFTVTKVGDTMVSFANPFTTAYQYGTPYYSVNFSNSSYVTANITGGLGSGDFTIEGWVRWTAAYGNSGIFHITPSGYLPSTGLGVALATYNNLWHLFQNNTGDAGGLGTSPALYTWYHFAMVRSGSTFKTYIDGVQIYSASDTTDYTSTTYLAIGAYYSSSYPFPGGTISNFRILRGTALYSGSNTVTPNFSVPTSPLTAITNTVFLGLQNSTLTDSSSNNFAISPASLSSIRVISASPFTPNSYSGTTLPTTYGSGYFDGSGDYITYGTFAPTGNFTFECWFFVKSYPQTQCMLFALPWGGSNFQVYVSNNNTVMWQAYTQNSQEYAITINQWYHIAIVKSGSSANLYLNGLLRDTSTLTNSINGVGLIGARNDGYNFAGYISDFRLVVGSAVYTSNFVPPTAPLSNVTNTQLLTLQYRGSHNNSTFNDDSTHNNLVTRSGNATNGTFSPYSITGWSTYFNGSSAFSIASSSSLTIPTSTTPFTLEMWVNITQNSTQQCFFTEIWPSTGNINFCFLLNNGSSFDTNGGYPSFGYYNGSWTGTFSTTVVPLNTWTHLAFVFTGSTSKIYMNGTDITKGTPTPVSSWGVTGTSNDGYYIAQRWDSLNKVNGHISNLRFVIGTAVYTSAFTPPTTPLSAIQNTGLLTLQSNRFIDVGPNNLALTLVSTPIIQSFSPFGGVTSIPTSYSVYFDGTGDYLTISTGTIATGTGDLTLECWAYRTSTTTLQSIVNLNAFNNGILIRWETTKVTIYVGGTDYSYNTPTDIPLNTWVHIALVRTSGVFRFYVNGTQTTTFNSNYSLSVTSATIGTSSHDNTDEFYGYISNVRFVSGTAIVPPVGGPTSPLTAVSGTQLLTCQSSTIIDNSTNYFTLTVSGDTRPRPFNPFGLTNTTNVPYSPTTNGGSMYFDGNSDFIRVTTNTAYNTLPASGFFTIEGWYYFSDVTINQQIIFTQRDFSSYQYVPYLIWTSSSGLVIYVSSDNGSWNIQNTISLTTGLTSNQWYHFAYTRSGSTFRFFVNGIQTYTFTSSAAFQNSGTFNLGMSPGETNTVFKGYVSDVRFLNGVCLYSRNFYPGSTPFASSVTVGSTTYKPAILLNGTDSGVLDASDNVNLETIGDSKITTFSPYTAGYYSNYFDGSGDTLTTANSASGFSFGTGDWTIEFWIKSTVTGRVDPFSWNYTYTSSGWASALFNTSSGTGGVSGSITWYENAVPVITADSTGWNNGSWKHFAVTRSGNSVKMFLDGSQIGTTYTTSFTYGAANSGLIIGASTLGSNLTGNISNFRAVKGTALYTTTFTPSTTPLSAISGTQLLTCQSNKFVDKSTNALAITIAGDPKVQAQNPFQINTGVSYYFDGSGDSLYAVSSPNFTFVTGDFTIEFWLYFTATANRQDIMWISTTGAATDRLGISWNLTSGNLTYYISPTIGNAINYAWTPTVGQWYHIALARSSGSTKLFVDGTQGGSTYTDSRNYNSQYALYIGQDSTGLTSPFNGYLSDIRITRGVARYTTTFTPPTTPFKLN